MTVTHGMNVAEVESLGQRLQTGADRLVAICADLESVVRASTWAGPDADRFSFEWWPAHKARLLTASERLHGFGQSALNNACEQRAASGEGGAGQGIGASGVAPPLQGSSPHLQGSSPHLQGSVVGGLPTSGGGDPDGGRLTYSPGPQQLSNDAIATAAERELREHPGAFRTGWSAPGECIMSTRRWVSEAGGQVGAGGNASSYQGVASEVPGDQAARGDVIQYVDPNAPDAFNDGVHTVVVVGRNEDGSLQIIERNFDLNGGIRRVDAWEPKPPAGWEARVYRYGDRP